MCVCVGGGGGRGGMGGVFSPSTAAIFPATFDKIAQVLPL